MSSKGFVHLLGKPLFYFLVHHLTPLLRHFFRLLYHPFAWTYDLVAWVVSFGRWKDWVRSVVPFITGTRILELGHGPGHLQRILLELGLLSFGLDESCQMGRLAKRRLQHSGYTHVNLTRGLAQFLPYPTGTFDNVIATFPSEYFFDPRTLAEVWRTLKTGGKFVVLPVAWITSKSWLDKFPAWLFRFTGQAPSDPVEIICAELRNLLTQANFQTEVHQVEVKSSLLLIVLAKKS